jgi:RES domain-containing protein
MEVFRIVLPQWSVSLHASGKAARWNSNGVRVIYTSASRSLSCLENVVHHNNVELIDLFRTMVIYIPDDLYIETVKIPDLPVGWHLPDLKAYDLCQPFGDRWVNSGSSAVLKIPSALVKSEYNYLINVNHRNFPSIKLIDTEPFRFDPRIKENITK